MARTPNTRSGSSSSTSDQFVELKNMIEQLMEENKKLKKKVEESLQSTEFVSNQYEDNKKVINEVLEKLSELTQQNKKLIEKNESLEEELLRQKQKTLEMEVQLYSAITPIELKKRENNLELHGVQEIEDENCEVAVKNVLSKISPEPAVISDCFRIGNRKTATGEVRKRAILIKFETKENRDKFYDNRTNLSKLKNQLYLNENLPKYLSALRGKANARRKEYHYDFLWTKNGNILVRKNQNSKVINIKVPSDLENIV